MCDSSDYKYFAENKNNNNYLRLQKKKKLN